VTLNGVLFTFSNPTQKRIDRFIDEVIKDGRIFISATNFNNTPALRVSITNWQTEYRDIEIAWRVFEDIYDKIK
jgi:hypothetical protein